MITQTCLYCARHLGSVEEVDDHTERISHGVCPECLHLFMAGTGQPIVDFLDSLPGIIYVIDRDGRFIGANTLGQKHASKKMDFSEKWLSGEVFECHHSKLPGGCGQTIHCKACTIRQAVTKTAETGISCIEVPAHMDLGEITDVKTTRFIISTEKVNDVVMLRIDEILRQQKAPGEMAMTRK